MFLFDDDACPIKLEHINATASGPESRFAGAFPHGYTEDRAAYIIIRMLQARATGFGPFTNEEYRTYCETAGLQPWESNPVQRQGFDMLVGGDFIRAVGNGYQVTLQFVARCFGCSPASWILASDQSGRKPKKAKKAA